MPFHDMCVIANNRAIRITGDSLATMKEKIEKIKQVYGTDVKVYFLHDYKDSNEPKYPMPCR